MFYLIFLRIVASMLSCDEDLEAMYYVVYYIL